MLLIDSQPRMPLKDCVSTAGFESVAGGGGGSEGSLYAW
jgi:hypothetical protein